MASFVSLFSFVPSRTHAHTHTHTHTSLDIYFGVLRAQVAHTRPRWKHTLDDGAKVWALHGWILWVEGVDFWHMSLEAHGSSHDTGYDVFVRPGIIAGIQRNFRFMAACAV